MAFPKSAGSHDVRTTSAQLPVGTTPQTSTTMATSSQVTASSLSLPLHIPVPTSALLAPLTSHGVPLRPGYDEATSHQHAGQLTGLLKDRMLVQDPRTQLKLRACFCLTQMALEFPYMGSDYQELSDEFETLLGQIRPTEPNWGEFTYRYGEVALDLVDSEIRNLIGNR